MMTVVLEYSRPVLLYLTSSRRTAVVHNMFPRAINIALGGTILTLLGAELPRMPNAIRLTTETLEKLYQNLRPGMVLEIGDGQLTIPDLAYSLHLPQAPIWEPHPSIEASRWCWQTVVKHTTELAHMLLTQGSIDGLAPLAASMLLGQQGEQSALAQMAQPALRQLMQATSQHDSQGIEQATSRLAGLGPGLTPSGDDALGGFAAVMALAGSPETGGPPELGGWQTRPTWGRECAAIIARIAAPRTTALSATLLAHAAQGEVAERVGDLLLALPAREAQAIRQRAQRLLASGATSGGDTLLGIALGLRTVQGGIPL